MASSPSSNFPIAVPVSERREFDLVALERRLRSHDLLVKGCSSCVKPLGNETESVSLVGTAKEASELTEGKKLRERSDNAKSATLEHVRLERHCV